MGKLAMIAGAALVVVAAYLTWPFVEAYQLAQAVRAGDERGFLERVDLAKVRRSIAYQAIAHASGGEAGAVGTADGAGGDGQEILANLIDARLAELLTPATVFELLGGRSGGGVSPGAEGPDGQDPAGAAPGLTDLADIDVSLLRGVSFRSPSRLRITVGENDDPAEWAELTFERAALRWQLTAVRLPRSVLEAAVPDIELRL